MSSKSYLSKSKLMSGRQCPKRLWLEVNQSELQKISPATERLFAIGHSRPDISFDQWGRKPYDASIIGYLTQKP